MSYYRSSIKSTSTVEHNVRNGMPINCVIPGCYWTQPVSGDAELQGRVRVRSIDDLKVLWLPRNNRVMPMLWDAPRRPCVVLFQSSASCYQYLWSSAVCLSSSALWYVFNRNKLEWRASCSTAAHAPRCEASFLLFNNTGRRRRRKTLS